MGSDNASVNMMSSHPIIRFIFLLPCSKSEVTVVNCITLTGNACAALRVTQSRRDRIFGPKTVMKAALYVLVFVFGTLLIVQQQFAQPTSQSLAIAGLKGSVTVRRDARWIPYIE